jgi:hypothetical protein
MTRLLKSPSITSPNRTTVIARAGGRSSNHQQCREYWMPAFAGMTAEYEARHE